MNRQRAFVTVLLMLIIAIAGHSVSHVLARPQASEVKIVDNQVWYDGKALTSTPHFKVAAVLSPDGRKIVYHARPAQTWGEVSFIDIQTGTITQGTLTNFITTGFYELVWLDNNTVAYHGGVNPNTDIYAIFDASTAQINKVFHGVGFTWDESKSRLYYTVPQPFFSPNRGSDQVFCNDELVYKSSADKMILGGPGPSLDESKIAFFECSLDGSNIELVVTEKSLSGKFRVQKRIKWEHAIGKISLDSKNTDLVTVDERYLKIRFDTKNERMLDVQERSGDIWR